MIFDTSGLRTRLLLLSCLSALAVPCAETSLGHLLARDELLATPAELPQAAGRHTILFQGKEGESGFNLHSYLAYFDGRFWAAWSSSKVGEEDPDQHVMYATSADGHKWSEAKVLAAGPDGPEGPQRWIARGLFVDGGKLRALGALIESRDYANHGKAVVWRNLRLIRFTWSGRDWKQEGVFADNCMNNFPPMRLKGQYAMPCRDSLMQLSVAFSDAPAAASWKHTKIDAEPPFDRMSLGSSTYHSLLLKLNKRFSHGFSMLVAYSNGKLLTDTAPWVTSFLDAAPSFQNQYNRRADKSIAPEDISQRLVVSSVWELPFGHGKALLSHAPRAVDLALGNW